MDKTPQITSTWQPSADLQMLRARARLLSQIRTFFSERDVLEVETPILSQAATTDPNIESFSTAYHGPGLPTGQPLYLATSPEFHMKRLLAAGSGDIYQVSRVFRQSEFGRWHNPEFTLLEWYRMGFDLTQLMQEVAQLVSELFVPQRKFQATEYVSYQEAFQRHLGINPHTANTSQLQFCASDRGVNVSGLGADDRDAWLDLLMSHCIQPHLGQECLCFIYEYPATQAALARLSRNNPLVAERFELFVDGVELANGFYELGDAQEQAHRFTADLTIRQQRNIAPIPPDGRLLEALKSGLPDCSGVAVGIDRILQIKFDTKSLQSCLTFPLDRA